MKCLYCGDDNHDVTLWFDSIAFCTDITECHQRWLARQTVTIQLFDSCLVSIRQEAANNEHKRIH